MGNNEKEIGIVSGNGNHTIGEEETEKVEKEVVIDKDQVTAQNFDSKRVSVIDGTVDKELVLKVLANKDYVNIFTDFLKNTIRMSMINESTIDLSEEDVIQLKEDIKNASEVYENTEREISKRLERHVFNMVMHIANELFTKNVTTFDRPVFNNMSFADNGIRPIPTVAPEAHSSDSHKVNFLLERVGVLSRNAIPLWHSGFHFSMGELPINLTAMLLDKIEAVREEEKEIRLHFGNIFGDMRDHKTWVAISDFVNTYRQSATANIPKEDDMFRHVSVLDMNIIIAGLWDDIAPKGHTIHIHCRNFQKCAYIKTHKVKYKDLLLADASSNRLPSRIRMNEEPVSGKYSPDEISKYRSAITPNKIIDLEMIDIDGDSEEISLSVTLHVPCIRDAVNTMSLLTAEIVSLAEGRFDTKNNDDLNAYVKDLMTNDDLLSLIVYIKLVDIKPIVDVNSAISDSIEIHRFISRLSTNYPITYKNLISSIRDYIRDSTIAVVGYKSFECPSCKARNESDEFNDVIPINILNVFTRVLTAIQDVKDNL